MKSFTDILSKLKGAGIASVFVCMSIPLQSTLALANPIFEDLGDRNSIIAGVSTPSLKDNVLYRPRWSLPPNGSLGKLPLSDESDDDTEDSAPSKSKKSKDGAGSKASEDKAEDSQPKTAITSTIRKPGQMLRSERLNLGQTGESADSDDSHSKTVPVAIKMATPAAPTKQPARQTATQGQTSALSLSEKQNAAPSFIGAPIPGQ